jgi:PAS domain S-box-containing protein
MPELASLAPARLRFSLAPEPARLLRARERIRDYLTLYCADLATIDDVVLAIDEAATNAIRHSGSSEQIEICLGFEGDDLLVVVKDQGHGFDIETFDPDKLPDPSALGGRGLYLMCHVTDECTLRRDGGLEVRMVKRRVARSEPPTLESGLGDLNAPPQRPHREARVRALLEEIDEAFVALDWEYRYLHANDAALRMAGKSLGELLGLRPWDIWASYAETPAGVAIREAMELGRPAVVEYRAVASDNWLEARIYPTPGGVSAYFRDITERKRIEAEREQFLGELGRSADRLELALRAGGAGTWDWDLTSQQLEWSAELYEIFGIDFRLPASSDLWNEILYPDDREIANDRH